MIKWLHHLLLIMGFIKLGFKLLDEKYKTYEKDKLQSRELYKEVFAILCSKWFYNIIQEIHFRAL